MFNIVVLRHSLQYFGTVGWAIGGHPSRKKIGSWFVADDILTVALHFL